MLKKNWKRKLPDALKALAEAFSSKGFQCFLVGGTVRDLLLGREVADYDIATDALPNQVRQLFRRIIPTGIRHGTVTVLYRGLSYEVTTFRVDGVYSDARHPDTISYSSSILEDLKRRDFTINSMAYDLTGGDFLDLHDGRSDLEQRLIRAVGVPGERFEEDGLRMMRACRFAAQLSFRIEENTFQGIRMKRRRIERVSKERIRDELFKIVRSGNPVLGFEMLESSSLLSIILPELHACVGVVQGDRHRYDVFHHSLHSCAAAPAGDIVLRLAALLHDIGKVVTRTLSDDGGIHFHRHEQVSAEMVRGIADRMKLSNALKRDVSHLVEHHMFNYQQQWSDTAIRRWVARVGRENVPQLLRLRIADQRGMGSKAGLGNLLPLLERMEAVAARDNAVSIGDLRIGGERLMERLGLRPGPTIGVLLRFLLEAVIDDPSLNTPGKLVEMAERFYRTHLQAGGE